MKIEKLIREFEVLLPQYEKACREDWNVFKLCENNLWCGLCCASDYRLESVFNWSRGYYKNMLTTGAFLFPRPERGSDLKNRIDFMKSEIKDLKRLQKLGYTHV